MSIKKIPIGQNNFKKYPYKEQGKELKALRGSRKIKEFAKNLGVAPRTYYRYETGERKLPDGLFKLAHLLIHMEFQEEVKVGDELDIKMTGPDAEEKNHTIVDSKGERPGPVSEASEVIYSQPSKEDLIGMAKEVLESNTEYEIGLAANIRAFYHALQTKKLLEHHNQCLLDYGKRITDLEERLKCAMVAAEATTGDKAT